MRVAQTGEMKIAPEGGSESVWEINVPTAIPYHWSSLREAGRNHGASEGLPLASAL